MALEPADLQAATHALRSGDTRYAAASGWPGTRFEFRSIATVQGRIGVLGVAPADCQRTTTLDDATTVETFLRHASIAIERTRLETEAVAVRKESEQELLRSALLASLSHNLRTSLASILGAATSLRELGPNLPTEARADLLAVSAAVRIPEQARLPVCRQNFSHQEKLGATLVRQFSRRLLLLGDVGGNTSSIG